MTAVLRLLSRRGEPSQRVRRLMVAFAVVGLPALVLISMGVPREVGLVYMVVLAAVLLMPLVVITEFRRNLFRRPNADERERQRRDDAYRLSYRVIELAVPLAALVFIFAEWLGRMPGPDWFVVWFVAFQYVIFLPYMVFAWREPDAAD